MNLFIIGKLKWTTDDNLHVRETELDYLESPVNTILHHSLKPHLHALKKSARHSQFSTCKGIGPKCNVAPVLKILGVPRLPPGGAKNLACRADFFSACKWV